MQLKRLQEDTEVVLYFLLSAEIKFYRTMASIINAIISTCKRYENVCRSFSTLNTKNYKCLSNIFLKTYATYHSLCV